MFFLVCPDHYAPQHPAVSVSFLVEADGIDQIHRYTLFVSIGSEPVIKNGMRPTFFLSGPMGAVPEARWSKGTRERLDWYPRIWSLCGVSTNTDLKVGMVQR